MRTPKTIKYRTGHTQFLNGTMVSSSDTEVQLLKEAIAGSDNPTWKDDVSGRRDASTPYSLATASNVHAFNGMSTSTYGAGNVAKRYDRLLYSSVPPSASSYPSVVSAKGIANSIFRRKMNDDFKDFQAFIPLAEINETRKIARQMNNVTVELLTDIRDVYRKRRSPRDILANASDLWLTYNFGVKPIVGDLQDAADSLVDYMTRTGFVKRYEAKFGTSFVELRPGFSTTAVTGCVWDGKPSWRRQCSWSYVGAIDFNVTNTADYTKMKHFHLYDPTSEVIPALWELTAYSWVLDYFGTIGEFLDDTFVSPPGETVFLVENYREDTLVKCDYSVRSTSPVYKLGARVNGYSRFNRFRFERKVLNALPKRELRFRSLDEIGYHGLNKIMNLASVLTTRKKL